MPSLFRAAVVAVLILTACGSCGDKQAVVRQAVVRRNAQTVIALDKMAAEVSRIVLALRMDAAMAEGKSAKDATIASGTVWDSLTDAQKDAITEPAARAGAGRFDATGATAANAKFIALTRTYARAVMAASGEPTWADVKPILRDLLAAYEELREALRPHAGKLPAVPTLLTAILE